MQSFVPPPLLPHPNENCIRISLPLVSLSFFSLSVGLFFYSLLYVCVFVIIE